MTTINKLLMATTGATFFALGNVSNVQAGTLGGQIFSTGGDVWVQVIGAAPDTAFTSDLYLYSPRSQYIGTNWQGGTVMNLGSFPVGQELIFGIYVRDTGNTFQMGPGGRNPDGSPHAIVDFVSSGVANVRFEDLAAWEDSDWNYADNFFQFRGGIASAPPRPPIITSLTKDLTVLTNTLFNFAATATDPDPGDILTFNWDFNNDGLYDDFTGSSGQWLFDRSGDYPVKLRVTDRYGLYADGSFNVKAVPEPTSSGLGLLAFGAFVASRIKRKQQQKVLNSVAID